MSERLAERRKKLLGELEGVTQRQLDEHASALQQLLNDARRTTESAIRAQSQHLTAALSDAEMQQRQQLEAIEQRLATAATQAERLSRVGGLRSWTRPLAITLAVMLAVGGTAAGGLLLTDRLIDSRLERLAGLLPQGVEIREIDGQTYLVGIRVRQGSEERRAGWAGLWRGRPVVQLTE